jgi:hypothetical protein
MGAKHEAVLTHAMEEPLEGSERLTSLTLPLLYN